jgi:hypothetical protein
VVVSPSLDVLAANSTWWALHSHLEEITNLARMVFLDPSAARFFVHLRHEETDVLAALNEAGRNPHLRGGLRALVRELSEGNPDFERLYSGPSVQPLRRDRHVIRHPRVGVLEFTRNTQRHGPHLLRIFVPTPATAQTLALLDAV